MGFFRGIESKYQARQIGMREVPEAVLGVVGTAPIHHVAEADRAIHAIRIVNSDDLGRRLFGPDLDGYTIPMAVEINAMEGGPLMLAINVFDPAIHNSPVPEARIRFDAMGNCALETQDWMSADLTSEDGAILYREGVDYTFDKVKGRLKRLPKAGFLPSDTLTIRGIKGDPGKVAPADILGAKDDAGTHTGLQLWRAAFQELGFFPTDLVCPNFEPLPSVRQAMAAMAHRIGAIAHVQMTAGLTVQDALAARGPSGPANFQVSSDRVKLFYPLYKSPRPDRSIRLAPLSLGYACVWGRVILERGFWHTGSNKPLRSAIGFERPIAFGGESDDANLLNAGGEGEGYRSKLGLTPGAGGSGAYAFFLDQAASSSSSSPVYCPVYGGGGAPSLNWQVSARKRLHCAGEGAQGCIILRKVG